MPDDSMNLLNNQPERSDQSNLRKKLATLLLVSLAAFSLTTWRLARVDVSVESSVRAKDETGRAAEGHDGDVTAAASVVEAQLDALSEGKIHKAYELFSARYRKEVSFEMYHDLIISHREMFETHELTFLRREVTGDRAIVETHTESEEGGHYVARFTLTRIGGRWWIDDVQWGEEGESEELTQV